MCFLDCIGYWDLTSEIASILLLGLIMYKTFINIMNLKKESLAQSEISAKNSVVRKSLVNYISLTYQCFLFVSILFSIFIFLVYQDDIREAGDHKINLWYKWSEIIFINLLNCLNLTIGLLYWKAVRAFFKISQKPSPIIYFGFVRWVFVGFYIINILIIIVSLAMLLITDETHY